MEQMVLTDQDNALVWGEDVPGAQRVLRGARREGDRGPRRRRGSRAAPAATCRRSGSAALAGWEDRFRGWLEKPTPQALLEAVDLLRLPRGARPPRRLSPPGRHRERPPAPARSSARWRRAPSPSTRRAGSGCGCGATPREFDMKLKGISPIVFLSRVYGLESASRTSNTLDRLRAAVAGGLIAQDTCETLSEAYRFLLARPAPRPDPRDLRGQAALEPRVALATCRRWSGAACATPSVRSRSGRSGRRTTTGRISFSSDDAGSGRRVARSKWRRAAVTSRSSAGAPGRVPRMRRRALAPARAASGP